MRKLAALIVVAFTVFCLVACDGMTSVGSFKSDIFTQEEFDDAVAAMQTYFENFEGCTLKEINYAGDETIEKEAELRGLDPNQVMVLKSTFETDDEDHNNGLEPGKTYEDYMWIFTREAPGASWEHQDHGYA